MRSGHTDGFRIEPAKSPATAADLRWQLDAEDLERRGLLSIQATAERWGTTLLAITGVLTSVTAYLGAAKVVELQPGMTQVAAGAFLGVAVINACAAVLAAALAAQGSVVEVVASGPGLRTAWTEAASRAHAHLTCSRVLSLGIAPLFLVGIAILTYGPQEQPARKLIVFQNGTSVCATSFVLSDSTLVIESGGRVMTFPASSVSRARAQRQC